MGRANTGLCDNCGSRIRCAYRQGTDLCHGCHNGFDPKPVPANDAGSPLDEWVEAGEQ